jgi:hypothetical protein
MFPTWSPDHPNTAGWYWLRHKSGEVWLVPAGNVEQCRKYAGHWSGPVIVPQFPGEGWMAQAPTVPGWYYFRDRFGIMWPAAPWRFSEFAQNTGYWNGPIDPPEFLAGDLP